MKPPAITNTRLFIAAGLLIGIALAMFVSPLASSSPDGLETVAEDQGFVEAGEAHALDGSPLADYGVRGVEDERTSTAVSGLIGVVLTFGIATGVFGAVRVWRERNPEQSAGARTAGGVTRSGAAADPT